MSKLQKALNALRDSQGSREDGKESADSRELLRGRDLLESRYERKPDRQKATDDITAQFRAMDLTPRKTAKVDIDKLADAGMFPRAEDIERISQQLRRAKRPVIQTAFETDLPTGDNSNVIMMASALPGAGKSFCALNMACSIALERDVGAVLVDADVLKPGISRTLGLQDEVGLIDYLVDPDIELADILIATDLNDIIVIPAGRRHPQATELLASRRMNDLVDLLSAQFRSRAVIFDTPPLLITNEAQVLAEHMGQIVFVVEARVSSQDSAIRALSLLDRDKPINAILNKSRGASGSGYRSDDYGYYPYTTRSTSDAVKA